MRLGAQAKSPAALKPDGQARALIVDGDSESRKRCAALFAQAGYGVATVAGEQAALETLAQKAFGVALVDCDGAGVDGLALLGGIKRLAPETTVVLASSSPRVEEAVAAIRKGAADYLVKPVEPERLTALIRIRQDERGGSPENLRKDIGTVRKECAFITGDAHMLELLEAAKRVAGTGATILITGESGTGKEILARHIHQAAGRPDRPFVAVNCAALPEALIESELFGHEKGAFTGASQRRVGKFEQVGEGTILLDEIGDMPLGLQPKILRILQERRIDRLGAATNREFKGQVIALTNQDLASAVQSGAFREDLYYRLNVIPFNLPPLRARRTDIPLLARHFIAKYETLYHKAFKAVDDAVLTELAREDWRGNVRELENRIERAVLLSPGPQLAEALRSATDSPAMPVEDEAVIRAGLSVRCMEEILISKTMQAVNHNRAKASELLGISVRTLRNKLNAYKAGQNEAHKEALS